MKTEGSSQGWALVSSQLCSFCKQAAKEDSRKHHTSSFPAVFKPVSDMLKSKAVPYNRNASPICDFNFPVASFLKVKKVNLIYSI